MNPMKTNSLLQLLVLHRIVIPPIQRDYAQGRTTGKIPHIRERFLDAIVDTLSNDKIAPLELDFVFGYIEIDKTNDNREISVFKPLDGQQRLTTLFLIHWYIANKENKMAEAKPLLQKFSYATRYSSRTFCVKLIDFVPEVAGTALVAQIVNQPWFFSAWQNDPTIASMLVVLNDIETKFNVVENVWTKLSGDEPRIVFHLLPMEELGLPDDLYIKMNARGKGLTDFEYFKSQFSEILSSEYAEIFHQKIDKEWSDLFWNIFKEKNSIDIAKDVDNGFLSFFWYITDILIIKKNIIIDSTYWLDMIKKVYTKNIENVKFLFESLSLFENLEKQKHNYFDDLFYIQSEDFALLKTRLFFNSAQTNLFRKCAETYGFGDKKNLFSVGEQLLLYAFIVMNLNKYKVDSAKFRLLRNLFSSSEVQLRNEYLSAFLYNDVESIIEKNECSEKSKLSKRQMEEECLKGKLIQKHPDLLEIIYKLEDHSLLRGNIALFELDQDLPFYANQFHKIFVSRCDYLEISKALLTFGNYTQSYGKLRRFGNKNNSTWRELFTQSESRKAFDITKEVLKLYLDSFQVNEAQTNKTVIEAFLNAFKIYPKAQKDLRYYYIKYNSFVTWGENHTDGYYWWDDLENKPYECLMMFRTQFNGRHWSPFLLELSQLENNCSLENYGNKCKFTKGELILYIKNLNIGFQFSAESEYSSSILSHLINKNYLNIDGILLIDQTKSGVDIEDRINKCRDFMHSLQLDSANN